jgi:putative restriction endonuclease
MTNDVQAQALETIQKLNVWHRRGDRAPHKPLLILLALSRTTRNSERLQRFQDLYEPLMQLLLRYAPERKHLHPEYPFWRLEPDIWEAIPRTGVKLRKGHSDPPKSELIRVDARGGFTEPIWHELRQEPQFVNRIAAVVLHAYFPGRLHADLVASFGLHLPQAWVWPLSLPAQLIPDARPW